MFFFDYDDYTNLASTGLRSGTPEGFLGKRVLKICRKVTGEHPCRSVISINFM